MTTEILIAGFGGQGVLSMGKILAYSGALAGKEVTWLPSYGPEQRGGTSNVTVIISDQRISSPIVGSYDVAILLNQQSITKFEHLVKPNGKLIYDDYCIGEPPTRTDINLTPFPATTITLERSKPKMFNTLFIGAFLALCPILTIDDVMRGLKKTLPPRYLDSLPDNEQAIRLGLDLISKQQK